MSSEGGDKGKCVLGDGFKALLVDVAGTTTSIGFVKVSSCCNFYLSEKTPQISHSAIGLPARQGMYSSGKIPRIAFPLLLFGKHRFLTVKQTKEKNEL